jgi:DNA-binding CsgD family transcriptional regulator
MVLSVEDLPDDPLRELPGADSDRDGVADGLTGHGEKSGGHVGLAGAGIPVPAVPGCARTPPSCCPTAPVGSATCSRTGWRIWPSSSTPSTGWPGGGSALDQEVVAQLLARSQHPLADLTGREREVLALMAEGRSNAAIAAALVVSEGAVAKHINSIFAKLRLAPADGDHRRVLAVLRYLGAG